jgi:hypothetical protein
LEAEMNSQPDSTRCLRWHNPPWILWSYLVFAVLATVWQTYGIDYAPQFYKKTVPFTGWSGFSVYPFTLIIVIFAIMPHHSRWIVYIAILLGTNVAFGLWDTCEHTWGSLAGRDDYGNPYLMYNPLQPLITVALPLFWAALLISPPMRRWEGANQSDRFFQAMMIRVMAPFMPSGIVGVEGKATQRYLQELFTSRFPKRKIQVIVCDFDVIEKKFKTLRSEPEQPREIPFRNRMFFVYELKDSERRQRFIDGGIIDDNIVVWSKNGIEHFYPRAVMKDIFQCGDADLKQMNLDSDEIEINGRRKSKSELSKIVCDRLTGETILNDELTNLLTRICESTG